MRLTPALGVTREWCTYYVIPVGPDLRAYSILVVASIGAFDISYCTRAGTTGCTTSNTDLVLRVCTKVLITGIRPGAASTV
eukprot:COSAG02_NODE_1915_length_10394_cov_5.038757_4_plen_81_part_00